MKSYLILIMCFLSLIQYFVDYDPFKFILAISVIVAFCVSIMKTKMIPRIFSIIMFAAGFLFCYLKGETLESTAQAIISNLPLLTLLVLVPLLSIPFRMGGYFDSVQLYLQRFKNQPRQMFMGISTVLFIISPILNLGSMRIVHEVVKDLRLNATLLSKSYLIGFTTTILWAPYYGAVAIVLLYLDVPVSQFILPGLVFGALFLVIGNILFGFWAKKNIPLAVEQQDDHHEPHNQGNKLKVMAFIILAIMIVTIITESITHWSMLVLVSLLSLTFPTIWTIFSRQWDKLKNYLIDYRDKTVPFMNTEITMYMSAGFFGQSLNNTSFGLGISKFMISLSQISFLLFAIFIVLTIVCVTFVGIHQVVVVTVLATQMDPVMLGTSKLVLALLIMLAWSISSILSPVNPINLSVSSLIHKSSFQVGGRDNGLYIIVITVIGVTLLTLIH